MEKILNEYNKLKNTPSDINEHLETLKKYAEECEYITEMGVRWCVSTWALLSSKPKKMISYDIYRDENINIIENITKEYNINYTFIKSDTLKIEIEKCDLLFIDTLHTYNQLYYELNIHAKNVKKYILLHDTISFGDKDEVIYNHASDIIKEMNVNKKGLISAVNDFLLTKEGKEWIIKEHYTNNNGLMVLSKK